MNTNKHDFDFKKKTYFSSKKAKKWIIEKLAEIVEICLTPQPLTNKQGELTGTFTYHSAEALKALELLGKSCGLFIPNPESATQPTINKKDLDLLKKVSKRILNDSDENSR